MKKKIICAALAVFLVLVNVCVPAMAVTTSSGQTVEVHGVTQSVQIPSGVMYSFNGYSLSSLPNFSDYVSYVNLGGDDYFKYHLIYKNCDASGAVSGYYYIVFSKPDPVRLVDGKLIQYLKSNYCYLYYWGSSNKWNPNSFYSHNTYLSNISLSDVVWTNFDLYDAYDGSLILSASKDPVLTNVYETISFPSSSYSTIYTTSSSFSLWTPRDLVSFGDTLNVSYSLSDPYVDWTWKGSGSKTYDGLTLDGDVSLDFALMLTLNDMVGPFYTADVFIDSFAVIVNGEVVSNKIPIEHDDSMPAGYWPTVYEPGNDTRFEYGHHETSLDSLEISFPECNIASYGLRFYLDSSLGLSDVSVNVTPSVASGNLESVVYVNNFAFPDFDFSPVVADPDPGPTDTPDPDPEPTVTPDPDPEPTDTTNPDPGPTATPDPDPPPTDSPDPEPEPSTPVFDNSEMGVLAGVITGAVNLFKIEITLYGYTFSLWQVMLFAVAASIIIWFVWRFLL